MSRAGERRAKPGGKWGLQYEQRRRVVGVVVGYRLPCPYLLLENGYLGGNFNASREYLKSCKVLKTKDFYFLERLPGRIAYDLK